MDWLTARDNLIDRLNNFDGNINKLSELSGVSRATMWLIKVGKSKNAGVETLWALESALNEIEGEALTNDKKPREVA